MTNDTDVENRNFVTNVSQPSFIQLDKFLFITDYWINWLDKSDFKLDFS